jgi:hypothetical protein
MRYAIAYFLTTVGGQIIVGVLVYLMRWTVLKRSGPRPGDLLGREQLFYHAWVGFTERSIATTLFIWAPTQVGLFLGGWTALKLAAAWTRRTNDDDHTIAHILALLGTAMSFAVAIAAGMIAHPQSLAIVNTVK